MGFDRVLEIGGCLFRRGAGGGGLTVFFRAAKKSNSGFARTGLHAVQGHQLSALPPHLHWHFLRAQSCFSESHFDGFRIELASPHRAFWLFPGKLIMLIYSLRGASTLSSGGLLTPSGFCL